MKQLGSYDVLEKLGEGGMGEVYRARDPRLHREVAIKVLHGLVATEPERISRFEQEARATAALNHPNILAVYDLGQHDGAPFIVSELLEGRSLRATLAADGALPPRKAIEYAVQIAQGLAAAHDKGIVHRDLKPDNVFITADGRAKILDFGLAKLTQPDTPVSGLSVLPTTPAFTPAPNTGAGVVMGTVGYMAPEQVRGAASDHRTDIFALGVVIYEMLAGRRAFGGDTAMDVMSAILKEDPPDLPIVERHIPPALARIVSRCLDKNPAARFQSARDLAFALDALTTQSGSGATDAALEPFPGRPLQPRRQLTWVPWAVAGIALVLAAGIAAVHFRETPAPLRSVRFEIGPPGTTAAETLALSQDGRQLAFVAATDGRALIWVRPLDAVDARPLPGTENATYPFWSPDGNYLAFFAQGKLKKIAIAGGPAVVLCDSPGGRGGSWNAAGVIIYSAGPTSPILQVSANGGTPTAVTKLPAGDANGGARFPSFLPDGDHFLYLHTAAGDVGIHVASVSRGTSVRLLPEASNAVFATSNGEGYLLFRREETLMAQRFDPATLQLSGDVLPIANPVPLTGNIGFGAFSASLDGTIVFRREQARNRELVWVGRDGKRLSAATKPLQLYLSPIALSPDQKYVAYSIANGDSSAELWVHDLTRDVASRFTFTAGIAREPVWSADSSVLYYGLMRMGAYEIHRKALSGNSEDERLIESGVNGTPTSVSADGQFLLFNQTGTKTDADIWVLPLTGDRKPVPYLQTPFLEADAAFAPITGPTRWVAYMSTESGRPEIYLQQFPASGSKYQVSTAGGESMAWRADAREMYYVENATLYAVPITLGASVNIGTPKVIGRYPSASAFAAAADGQRFLTAVPQGGSDTASPITAVLNWAAGLKH